MRENTQEDNGKESGRERDAEEETFKYKAPVLDGWAASSPTIVSS